MLADEGVPNLEPRHSSTTFPRRLLQDLSDNVFEEPSCSGYVQPPPPSSLSPRTGPTPGIILTLEGEEEEEEDGEEEHNDIHHQHHQPQQQQQQHDDIPPEIVNVCGERSSSSSSARSSRRSRHQSHPHHQQQHQLPHHHHHHHHQTIQQPQRSPSVTRMRRNGSNHKLREPAVNGTSSCVSRSQSMRTARRPHSVDPNQRFRQRISSIPNDLTLPSDLLDPQRLASNQSLPLPGDEADILRLRNFAVTPKGVINRGDSFRSKSRSAHSVSSLSSGHTPIQRMASDDSKGNIASCAAAVAAASSILDDIAKEQQLPEPQVEGATSAVNNIIPAEPRTVRYRVLVLGAPDVGKSSLTRQFMTSEYICAYDSSIDEDNEKTVTVILNGEESELTFIEHTFLDEANTNFTKLYEPDAYLVVYSVAHKRSLQMAKDIFRLIHKWDSQIEKKALILVGNKMDLARLRMLTTDDGRSLAMEVGSKFIETSAGINHHVDELLVGILTQIRLKLSSAEKMLRKRESVSLNASAKGRSATKCAGCAGCKAKGIFKKILKKACNRSKSCDNLHVL